jgi:hypothetical protein
MLYNACISLTLQTLTQSLPQVHSLTHPHSLTRGPIRICRCHPTHHAATDITRSMQIVETLIFHPARAPVPDLQRAGRRAWHPRHVLRVRPVQLRGVCGGWTSGRVRLMRPRLCATCREQVRPTHGAGSAPCPPGSVDVIRRSDEVSEHRAVQPRHDVPRWNRDRGPAQPS